MKEYYFDSSSEEDFKNSVKNWLKGLYWKSGEGEEDENGSLVTL